jgi:hypothetical protein
MAIKNQNFMNRFCLIILINFILSGCFQGEEMIYSGSYLNEEKEVVGFVAEHEINQQEFPTTRTIIEIRDTLKTPNRRSVVNRQLIELAQDSIFEKLYGDIDPEFNDILDNLSKIHIAPRRLNKVDFSFLDRFKINDLSSDQKVGGDWGKVIFNFSRVSFNKDLSRACVYGEHTLQLLSSKWKDGIGRLYFLERKNDTWEVVKEEQLWAI